LAVTQIAAPFVITAHAAEAARCDQECKIGSEDEANDLIRRCTQNSPRRASAISRIGFCVA
jgi:hypothetical protein